MRFLLFCGVVALLAIPAALAGKGQIALDQTAPLWGAPVTFTFTPAATLSSYVLVTCGAAQGRNGEASGALLYQAADYPAVGAVQTDPFVLPLLGQVGYCTGKLFDRGNGTQAHLLASTSFTATTP